MSTPMTRPSRADALGQLQNRLPGTATDVDHHVARYRGQGVDRAHPQGRQLEVEKLADTPMPSPAKFRREGASTAGSAMRNS